MSVHAFAQTDDLMIVEYIDQPSGSGWAVTIANPTNQSINLTAGRYKVKNQANGNQIADSVTLTGILAPGAVIKVGNTTYCNQDCNNCDQTTATQNGINGDDFIGLFKGNNQFVDMIGRWGDRSISGYRIGTVTNALFETRLVRNASNCNRYTNTSGSGPNSWPSSSTTQVTGWTAARINNISCLQVNQYNSSFSPGGLNLGPDVVICSTVPFTINSNLTGPGLTYEWSTGQTGAPSITVNRTGKYALKVSNGSCFITDTIEVTFSPPTSAGLGGDISKCEGQRVVLRPAVTGTSYLWSNGLTSDTILVTRSGTYHVTVNNQGCISRDTVNVTIEPKMVGFAGPNRGLCAGDSLTLSVPTGYLGRWSTGQIASSIRVGQAGNYTVALTAPTVCQWQDTVVVNALAALPDTMPAVISTCTVLSERLTAPSANSYLWSTGDTSRAITPGRYGTYQVTIFKNGCSKLLSTDLIQRNCDWYLPNVLTDNADGSNEVFTPSQPVFASASTKFYDRYGRMVSQTEDPMIKWAPNNVNSGVYFYLIKAVLLNGEEKTYKGYVEVLK